MTYIQFVHSMPNNGDSVFQLHKEKAVQAQYIAIVCKCTAHVLSNLTERMKYLHFTLHFLHVPITY